MSDLISRNDLLEWFTKYFDETDKVDNREIHEVIENFPDAMSKSDEMKIILEIPEEFKSDYLEDRFEDFFSRVIMDLHNYSVLSGNYEMETLAMLTDSFGNSEILKGCENI